MNECDRMDEVIKAIEACNGYYSAYEIEPNVQIPDNRQWDRIICTLCAGCGKPLSRHDNFNRHAYCMECREILFPETVASKEFLKRGSNQDRGKGHFL